MDEEYVKHLEDLIIMYTTKLIEIQEVILWQNINQNQL